MKLYKQIDLFHLRYDPPIHFSVFDSKIFSQLQSKFHQLRSQLYTKLYYQLYTKLYYQHNNNFFKVSK